jgi:hypothetical protein
MKVRLGVVAVALVLAGSAAAQRLPDVVGHPENALIPFRSRQIRRRQL